MNPETGKIDTFLLFKPLFGAPEQAESEKLFTDRKNYDHRLAESVMKRFCNQRLKEDKTDFSGEVLDMETPKLQRESVPWWKDEQYIIGQLTSKSRWINIKNRLLNKAVRIEVIIIRLRAQCH